MNGAIRVAVVEPQPLLRQGMVLALAGAGVAVVAEGQDFHAVAHSFETAERPHILIIDSATSGKRTEAFASALRLCAEMKVIVLASSENSQNTIDDLQVGVSGFFRKSVPGAELVDMLQAAHRGEAYISSNTNLFATASAIRPASAVRSGDPGSIFLRRELSILGLLTKGQTNQEIARILGLHVRTVKIHITRIFRKLGVRNRVGAVLAVRKMNLVSENPSAKRVDRIDELV